MKNDLKTILNSSVNVAGCSVDLPADAVQGESEDSTFVLSVRILLNIENKTFVGISI